MLTAELDTISVMANRRYAEHDQLAGLGRRWHILGVGDRPFRWAVQELRFPAALASSLAQQEAFNLVASSGQ